MGSAVDIVFQLIGGIRAGMAIIGAEDIQVYMTKLSLECQVQDLLKVTSMMFKLQTRHLTTASLNIKVLTSGKYFSLH